MRPGTAYGSPWPRLGLAALATLLIILGGGKTSLAESRPTARELLERAFERRFAIDLTANIELVIRNEMLMSAGLRHSRRK